ncbi:S8 family serine peptidase [Cellulosimicrobium composti]|uniref:S8 family serine peptidase n=1 Tax=Cellulosimicrobium composti TaxID=2672572 RepID=UPI0037BD6F8D
MRLAFKAATTLALAGIITCAALLPAQAGSDVTESYTSAASYNLGGGVVGEYADGSGRTYDDAGTIVVDVDGAFYPEHSAFAGRVAGETCFGQAASTTPFASLCAYETFVPRPTTSDPSGGYYFSTLPGVSEPSNAANGNSCTDGSSFCHETHGNATAGIIAGAPFSRWETPHLRAFSSGVAPGAKLYMAKIGGGTATTAGWPHASVVDALNWVERALVQNPYIGTKAAAVNLSVSGAPLPEGQDCPSEGTRIDEAAGRLKELGVAVVMAAGNNSLNGLGTWNCGKNIIRVGATQITDPTEPTSYTNISASIPLFAPVGDGDFAHQNALLAPYKSAGPYYVRGTSFAAPQVAGAFAVLLEKFGAGPTVDELTDLLVRTGQPLTGPRSDTALGAVVTNLAAALHDTP